ncbi:DNA-directed RNA polymerase I subunit RPA43-like [Lytechinus variegatus]|uniref:DNA-directed RNA polymerase I subunit RPA43-like n=1 Tax=Lytechinus variegatus TaxID=7654 RepID=UPI001BB154ED|nr:DNA-directed RNA polymerase I subunit RPA43-like [Lytechinus variegatus]
MCNFTVIHDNSGRSPSRMSNVELFGIFKKAAKLTKDPCNGCCTVVSQRHFALSPRYLGRLKKGAMEALESEIGYYSESLGGVPLAYCNLQLLQQTGNILDDQPYIHFNVSFKAVIFKPSLGSILKCVVNELAKDHVSCLVHNWFNLSLPLRGSDAEERLPKGSKVMAKVTKIQAKNGILAIQGTPTEERFSDLPLVDPLKQDVSDGEGAEDTAMETDAPEKRKHDSGFISDPENSAKLPLESTSENDGENVGKKKKKKRKTEDRQMDDIVVKVEPDLDVSADGGMEGIIEGECIEGKKKKKKKKDKKRGNEMNDSLLETTMKKEPGWSLDEDSTNVVDDGSNVEQILEKKKKKKKKSNMDGDVESIVVKTEVIDPEELIDDVSQSGKKKKKKKHKERVSENCDHNMSKAVEPTSEIRIKIEPGSDDDQMREKKVKSKKHKQRHIDHQISESDGESEGQIEKQNKLKRKHSDVFCNVNGGGDHGERTTQNEIHGTNEGIDSVPKKKKKKKKHIKEEVI